MIKRTSSSLTLLGCLITAIIAFFISTHAGLTLLLNVLPGSTQYRSIEGTLLSTVSIDGFQYQNNTYRISFDHATFSINMLDLFYKKFHIENLEAGTLNIDIFQKKNKKHRFSDFKIILDHIDIKTLSLNQKRTFTNSLISGSFDHNLVHINTFETHYLNHDISLSGLIDLYRWRAIDITGNVTTKITKQFSSKLTLTAKSEDHLLNITIDGDQHTDAHVKLAVDLDNPDEGLKGDWALNIAQLRSIRPDLAGAMQSKGSLAGTLTNPLLDVEIAGQNIRTPRAQLTSFNLASEADFRPNGTLNIDLTGKEWRLSSNHMLNTVQLNTTGTFKQHHSRIEASMNNNNTLKADINGGFDQGTWTAVIQDIALNLRDTYQLSLDKPATLTMDKHQGNLSETCLSGEHGKLCGQANWSPEQWGIQSTVDNLSLSLADPWLSNSLSLTGSASGDVTLTHLINDNINQGSLDLQLSEGAMHYGHGNQTNDFQYDPSEIQLSLDQSGLRLNTSIQLKDQPTSHLKLDFPGLVSFQQLNANQTLSGHLDLNTNDLSFLAFTSAAIENPKGDIDANIDLSGTVAKPDISGHASLKNGSITLLPLDTTFDDINANITTHHNGILDIDALIGQGENHLNIVGNSDFDQMHFVSRFTVTGNDVTIFDSPSYKLIASPDLNIYINAPNVTVMGKIDVPYARISPQDFKGAVTLPKDVIIIHQDSLQTTHAFHYWQPTLKLNLTSQQLDFNYAGVKGKVKGKLQLSKTPETELKSTGNLKVTQGTYSAYAQNLTITPGGTLVFNGEISNPQLNLEATKIIDMTLAQSEDTNYQNELTVGATVQGTLNKPILNLFSIPATLNQQDILSYIAFGFSQDQLTDSQTTLVWEALNAMDSDNKSVGGMRKHLQNTLGLNELGLTTTSEYNPDTEEIETGTSLVLGKRIGRKLSMTLSLGLEVPVNVLYLRYKLSHRWSIRTDSSTLGYGSDLMYSISRD